MAISLEFVFSAINQVTGTFDRVARSMSEITSKANVLREGLEDMNTQLTKVGQAAGQGFNAASNAMREAIRVGAEYDFVISGMSGALKGLNPSLEGTTIDFEQLNSEVRELAILSGESTIKIAKGAKLLTEAGLTLEETQSTLNDAILLATVPGQDFDRVAGILISTVRSLGLELHETGKLVDAFAGISLATGIDEIDTVARSFGLASGAMQEFGLELGDVSGIMALLSESFVVSAGGIESFTLVGNTMVNFLQTAGEAGLFTAEVQDQIVASLGEEAEQMGKVERVLRFLRREMNAGNVSAEQVNDAFQFTGRTAQGMTKLLRFTEKEFSRLITEVNQAGIAQRNFNEVAQSTQRRIGALNAVVEQMQILFFEGLGAAIGDSLQRFFEIIGGAEGNRAALVVRDIGEGVGMILGPALNTVLDIMEEFLSFMEEIGPTGRQAVGVIVALGVGFLGLLSGVRILVPIFKVLIGLFGLGNTTAGLIAGQGTILARIFTSLGGVLGLAGNSLSIFVRGMGLLSKAFLPIAGIIGTVKGLFKIFGDGYKSILDLVEGIGSLSGGLLAFAALIPGPQQPIIALIALIVALIDAFQLWDDILGAVNSTLQFFGLGGFDMKEPVLHMGTRPKDGQNIVVNNNIQGDAIGTEDLINKTTLAIENTLQKNRNIVE